MSVSPFAPATLPAVPTVDGVELAACEAGIRYAGRKDLLLVRLAPGAVAGGVLTRSKTASAPVAWCRERLPAFANPRNRRQLRERQRLHRLSWRRSRSPDGRSGRQSGRLLGG